MKISLKGLFRSLTALIKSHYILCVGTILAVSFTAFATLIIVTGLESTENEYIYQSNIKQTAYVETVSELIDSVETSVVEEDNSTSLDSLTQNFSRESITVSSCDTSSHAHNYYRPRDYYKYIGDGNWDGSGWRDEETRGMVFPTCTEEGFTVFVCSVCGHVKYDDYVAATGHNFKETIEYIYPGYQTAGYSYYSCSTDGCSKRQKIETYPARQGDLSGLDSAITYDRTWRYDSYSFDAECSICIIDRRTWGSIPIITVDYQEKSLTVKYRLKDGSLHSEKILFPNKVSNIEGLYYWGEITQNGNIEGNYMKLENWDGNGN